MARERERERGTIRSIDFDGRHIRGNEHKEEFANGVSESEDEQRPPKRHRFEAEHKSKTFFLLNPYGVLANENLRQCSREDWWVKSRFLFLSSVFKENKNENRINTKAMETDSRTWLWIGLYLFIGYSTFFVEKFNMDGQDGVLKTWSPQIMM